MKKINEIIEDLGISVEIINLFNDGYSLKQISEYLLSQNIKLTVYQLKTFLNNKGIETNKAKRTEKEKEVEKINDLTLRFPVINVIEILKDSDIETTIDNDDTAIKVLQKCQFEIYLQLFTIAKSYLNLYLNGELKMFPVEIVKMFLLLTNSLENSIDKHGFIISNKTESTIDKSDTFKNIREQIIFYNGD
jgi:hypothetical protein